MYQELIKREMTIGTLVKITGELFGSNFKNLTAIVIIFSLPLNAVRVILKLDTLWAGEHFLLAIIYNLLSIAITILPTIAMIMIINAAFYEEEMKIPNAVKIAFQRWGKVLKTNFLMLMILSGLSLLLVIPGVIWFIYYSFVNYIVVLRNKEFKKALDYSKLLVKGSWWRIFIVNIIFIILSSIYQKMANYFIEISMITIILQTINGIIFSPSILIINFLMFINLEHLKENKLGSNVA